MRPAIATYLLLVWAPSSLSAQEILPADLARVEEARSRACVGSLARLAELEASLQPYFQRADRLNALGRAVSLENRSSVEPLDTSDTLEAEVAAWFSSDSALAVRYIAQPDSSIAQERDRTREALLEKLRQAIVGVSDEAQGRAEEGAPIEEAAQPCIGAIFVRSAVLDECAAASSSLLCEGARAEGNDSGFMFVDNPEEVWDLEQYGPWSAAGPMQLAPNGALVGGRTGARARKGNLTFTVNLMPLLRQRSELTEEEIGQFEANLDSLGFTFEHPLVAMAPGLEVQLNLPPPVGGEDVYILHFGDLSGEDVIWSVEADAGGLVQAIFPAHRPVLDRLRAGEVVSLTAVQTPEEEGGEGVAVFTVSLLQVGQASNVDALLQYMSDGTLGRDLLALIAPGGGG